MRALILLIICILASIGAQARTLLENHQQLNIGSSYGRPADLSPPSPSSSPPTKEVSPTVSSGTTTSENSELLIMSTSYNELLSFKKLFVSYLLPVSYVWNLIVMTSPSLNNDDSFEYKSFDEKHWRPRPKSPPSPKPSDHHGQTIINTKFDDENNNSNYGRPGGKGKLSPPAPQYDPPIHQVTSNGDQRSLSNPFLAST